MKSNNSIDRIYLDDDFGSLYDHRIIVPIKSLKKKSMRQIRKKSLSDAVLDELKRMIQNDEIRVGEKLPNQNDLAAQLGVSRTSLREAISKLALFGAIDQKPGVGTVLISKYLALNADTISLPLMSDIQAASELNEARSIIEIGAASLAAVCATDLQLKKARQMIRGMEKALEMDDAQKYIEQDMAFHLQVAQSTNNRFIIYSYHSMQGYIEQYIQECLNLIPEMQKTSIGFHINIYQAIKSRDAEKAAQQMKTHIEDIRQNYKRLYEVAQKV